ncbi:hypothetical protein S245_056692, partial [Arachis hypogaea]
VSKITYSDIINKMNLRLNSWKASSLSLAGRATLVRSVLSSLPSYTMQTALIPVSTSNLVDRKCRDFLWGETEHSRKIHLINWKDLSKLKASGGLGICHTRD